MAYRIQSINPLDLKPSTGIGVAIPFNSPRVFTTVYTTKEQLKYNLINFILTEPGERLFNPGFGLGLRRKLFEQMNQGTYDDIKEYVIYRIQKYFTNVEVFILNIAPGIDPNSLLITLRYRILNTGGEEEITINLGNV